MKSIRIAKGVILGAAFLMASCTERDVQEPVAVPSAAFLADNTGAKTSVILDPVGDVVKKGTDYQDVVRAEITKQGGNFIFVMRLAAAVPVDPPVPSGSEVIIWVFPLDTDPNAFPAGYPFDKNSPNHWDLIVELRAYRPGFTDPLDPTRSGGILEDRRPLLTGGQAIVTPIQFSVDSATITFVVDAALLGDPSMFQWSAGTASYSASNEIEKNGYVLKDIFDVALFNGGLATWPQ